MDYLNKLGKIVQKNINSLGNKSIEKHFLKMQQTNPRQMNANIPKKDQTVYSSNIARKESNDLNTVSQPQADTQSQSSQEKKVSANSLITFLNSSGKKKEEKDVSNELRAVNDCQQNLSISKGILINEFVNDFYLIRGETQVHHEKKCEIRIEELEYPCKALITGYCLHLKPSFNTNSVYEYIFPSDYFSIPIHIIQSCEKTIDKKDSFKYLIEITTKDNREIDLLFRVGQNEAFHSRLTGLLETKEGPNYSSFAMLYNNNYEPKENGWNIYDAETEYIRQGITTFDTYPNKTQVIRKTIANINFKLCESYPQFLLTIGQITDEELRQAANYRTKNRLPALAYFYYKNGATLWRSSQTKSGLANARNEYDEKYLSYISALGSEKKVYIFDCRPYLSACANKLKGAGFENREHYVRAEIVFCEIDNIHVARSALSKLYSILASQKLNENRNFFSSFEQTRWPEFIYLLIKGGINIANSIKKGNSALIHCSDGWDRASQLTAFSQLLIDPYFRTLRGYMVLIEKEFLSFGHQFKYRNGYYGQKEFHEDQNSPILLQWLDATHQLLVQFPMYFEFNMQLLLFIASNIYSGKYGTFLYNNEKDRLAKDAKKKTMSIWTEVLEDEEHFYNPYYNPNTQQHFFFTPQFSYYKIRLWEEYFLRFTQLQASVSCDHVMTLDNSIKDDRLLSTYQYIFKDKEKTNIDLYEKKTKIESLVFCVGELIEKSEINLDKYNTIPEETRQLMKDIETETLDGKMENESGDKMIFVKKKSIIDNKYH